jgi:hypothetical protein
VPPKVVLTWRPSFMFYPYTYKLVYSALSQVKIYKFERVRVATSTSNRTRYKFGLLNLSNITMWTVVNCSSFVCSLARFPGSLAPYPDWLSHSLVFAVSLDRWPWHMHSSQDKYIDVVRWMVCKIKHANHGAFIVHIIRSTIQAARTHTGSMI